MNSEKVKNEKQETKTIEIRVEVEELEAMITPGISVNHNETLVRDLAN